MKAYIERGRENNINGEIFHREDKLRIDIPPSRLSMSPPMPSIEDKNVSPLPTSS